jgi:hypothetical protein
MCPCVVLLLCVTVSTVYRFMNYSPPPSPSFFLFPLPAALNKHSIPFVVICACVCVCVCVQIMYILNHRCETLERGFIDVESRVVCDGSHTFKCNELLLHTSNYMNCISAKISKWPGHLNLIECRAETAMITNYSSRTRALSGNTAISFTPIALMIPLIFCGTTNRRPKPMTPAAR